MLNTVKQGQRLVSRRGRMEAWQGVYRSYLIAVGRRKPRLKSGMVAPARDRLYRGLLLQHFSWLCLCRMGHSGNQQSTLDHIPCTNALLSFL